MSVHTSRTMMLEELSLVLAKVPVNARNRDYLDAITEQNILGKPTRTTRDRTAKRLTELYTLDLSCPIFRSFRRYWDSDQTARSMLAFLGAAARDPLLRETTPFVLGVPAGEGVAPEPIARYLGEKYPQRFGESTAIATAQRLASTWTQAGFLRGKARKKRTRPRVTPVVLTFAIGLGLMCGLRGKLLLQSRWAELLDRTPGELQDLAFEASTQGWMNYKSAGEVVEITLPGNGVWGGEVRL